MGLNTAGNAGVSSVSCARAGNCSAGGFYTGSSGQQAFVANENGGVWHAAVEVPGTGALNTGGSVGATSISCASTGNCSAGGSYTGSSGQQAFVANENRGVWHAAVEVPGTAALNAGEKAGVTSLSCAPAGTCSVGGEYTDSSARVQAFVVNGS